MATTKSATKKKSAVKKSVKKTAVKKSAVKKAAPKKSAPKKSAVKKSASAAHRKTAANKRALLASKLRTDLKATKETLKAVKNSANAEIAVLKDQLNAARKREAELMKVGERKVKAMVAAGEVWERKQMSKIKKIAGKYSKKK